MSTSLATTSSFMKTPRIEYRVRGGKLLGLVGVLLVILLVMLIFQIGPRASNHMAPQRTIFLVMLDLAALLALMTYGVIYRATILWQRSRGDLIGTRLQSRIILMFCGIAIVPTIIVATFSILFFNVGIKSWFDTQVSSALEDSVTVATAYIEEHKDAIRTDAIGLAEAIHADLSSALSNPALFNQQLNEQTAAHNLSEAILLDRQRTIARSELSFSLMFERLPEEILQRADARNVVIFGDAQDKIQAVIKVGARPDLYLMVVRVVDPQVLNHMQTARETVDEYNALQQDLAHIQRQFFVVFVLVALIVLLASLWAGMLLAVRLIEPLRSLMEATERVRAGDYAIKVPEGRADDEIANLGRTFNRMTGQLESQRRDLMNANRLADERRRFTEAVLSGVSAGIIALDSAQQITLHNRTALELLGREESLIHQPISAILPEVAALVRKTEKKPDRIASADVVVLQKEKRITLHVQVTAERLGDIIEGYIVTFDDISELVAAQRSAAWADVARRIAHEIKNPLTPITLSAERLRKKFGPDIGSEEREAFERYLDTIGRHVRDIGRMVEEFVAFARLPASVFHEENLGLIIRKSIFSEQTVHPEIRYITQLPETPVMLTCDEAQFGQMFLNLLKNAAEALESAETREIRITITQNPADITVTVADSGPGFPSDKIATLTEPYVTTRVKGTGLGLAIVKRTVEEHKGTLNLSNAENGGAVVTIVFPL